MLINCCLIFVNYFEPCLFRTLFHRGLEKEDVNTVSFGLIIPLFSCCSADNLSESLSQSLILSEVLLALLFPVSPSWCIFAQVQGEELNFSFQYLPHCSGGDVVHNSRFSHLIYSLNPPSLFFFSLSLSFLLSLLPAVNDWSGTDRPPLRSVLLQRCPLSCFYLFLSLRRLPLSTYLSAIHSVSVSINHLRRLWLFHHARVMVLSGVNRLSGCFGDRGAVITNHTFFSLPGPTDVENWCSSAMKHLSFHSTREIMSRLTKGCVMSWESAK